MNSSLATLRQSIKNVSYFNRVYLNLHTFRRYCQYRIRVDDDCVLKEDWDFNTEKEKLRHAHAFAAIDSVLGQRGWGDVLEIGCHTGQFTEQIAKKARHVFAIDVSERYCYEGSQRCSGLRNTDFSRINVVQDAIPGKFDIAFAMGVLCYIKGAKRQLSVLNKLYSALRAGGLLLVQEMRLIPEVENSLWARWLDEGAFHICDLIEKRSGFRIVKKLVTSDYMTMVFQKDSNPSPSNKLRSLVPRPFKYLRRHRRTLRRLKNEALRHGLDKSSLNLANIAGAAEFSLISPEGLLQLRTLAMTLDRDAVPGDIVECGVYRGGSALVLGAAANESSLSRHLWLFDSFAGLPPSGPEDGPSAALMPDRLVSNPEQLQRLLERKGVHSDKTTVVAGWFDQTLSRSKVERIALLHVDADWFSSVKLCLDDLYDRVSVGGFIVIDDYEEWPGCKSAVDRFIRARGLEVRMSGGGEVPCYFRKTK